MNEYGFSQGIARNASQSEYPNLWRGLVGLWSPSAGVQGNKLIDFSSNRSDGTLTNGATWGSAHRVKTIALDGTDDYVSFGSRQMVSSASPFSITITFRLDAFTGTFPGLFSFVSNEAAGFCAFANTTDATYRPISFGGSTGWGRFRPTTDFSSSLLAWSHIVITYDGVSKTSTSSFALWRNGQSFALTTANLFAGHGNSTTLGKQGTAANYIDGNIAEARVYNRVLSPSEIMQSYMGASPLVRAVQTYGKSVSSAAAAIFRNRTGSRSRLIA